MDPTEKTRFDGLYKRHLRALKLQGLSDKTIDAYGRAVRRLADHFGCCPDQLSVDDIEGYFAELVDSHSWSTVKVDRNGLQFFWKYVLKREWTWIDIVNAPKIQSLPDILTATEIEQLLAATKNLRYRVFFLTTYSMGLRLSETLSLQIGDIDSHRMRVHIRRGKGHKDRIVPLPDLTLRALRELWRRHRNPQWLFPSTAGSAEQIQQATKHMDRGATQAALKAVLTECGVKKRSPCTRCATALPPTCSSRDSARAISRGCLAM